MQHSLSWKANQVNNLILRAKSFRLSRSSTFTVSNQKKGLRFSHRSRCCVCHTSSNFLLLALRDACVNVCILFRLAVKVFVISAGKKKWREREYYTSNASDRTGDTFFTILLHSWPPKLFSIPCISRSLLKRRWKERSDQNAAFHIPVKSEVGAGRKDREKVCCISS